MIATPLPDASQLVAFLRGAAVPLPAEQLRVHQLAAYAYTTLAADRDRASLHNDFLLATARHAAVKAELLPLLRAWAEAGVKALLFKGFYLAEFVYQQPAQRFYEDVDILLEPKQAPQAAAIARDLRWRELGAAYQEHSVHATPADVPGEGGRHAVTHLESRGKRIQLDIHQRILHHKTSRARLQERFTTAAWEASRRLDWEGVPLRVLHPTDSLLMGLILSRAWSDDGWQLKPHDFLDFGRLIDLGVSREALTARAKELNCRHSVNIFLSRCDAFSGKLELRAPNWGKRQWWYTRIMGERGHLGLENAWSVIRHLPGTLQDMARELPSVLRALRLARHYERTQAMVAPSLTAVRELSYEEWRRIRRGVRRDLALLGVSAEKNPLPRTLAQYLALRAHGCPVRLRVGGCAEKPLWLELDGRELRDWDPLL